MAVGWPVGVEIGGVSYRWYKWIHSWYKNGGRARRVEIVDRMQKDLTGIER